MPPITPVPQHIAIIMDGNGRWAQQRGLSRLEGHRAGTENIRRVVEAVAQHGVGCLTLFAFSTENWSRPRREIQGLLRFLGKGIDRETEAFYKMGIQLRYLGRLDGLSRELQEKVKRAIELTQNNHRMTLCVAFDYGGRAEIIEAIRSFLAQGPPPRALDEAAFSRHLYTAGLPDPDLLIRTGGELRISNFFLWQLAYTELYFTTTFWPDFNEPEVEKALIAYSQRQRRFGRIQA